MGASVKMRRGDKYEIISSEKHCGLHWAVTAVFYWLWGSGARDSDLSIPGGGGWRGRGTPCFRDFDPVATTALQMWASGSCCFCTDPVVTCSVVSDDGHSADPCSLDHRNVTSGEQRAHSAARETRTVMIQDTEWGWGGQNQKSCSRILFLDPCVSPLGLLPQPVTGPMPFPGAALSGT